MQSFDKKAGIGASRDAARYYHVAPEDRLDSILGEKALVSEKTDEEIKTAKRNIQDMLSVQYPSMQRQKVAELASEIFHNRKFFNVSSPVGTIHSNEHAKRVEPASSPMEQIAAMLERMIQRENKTGPSQEEMAFLIPVPAEYHSTAAKELGGGANIFVIEKAERGDSNEVYRFENSRKVPVTDASEMRHLLGQETGNYYG